MTGRSAAAGPHVRPENRRPSPHRYWEDRDNPGCCRRCRLIKNNRVHTEQAAREQRQAEREAERAADYIDPSQARRIREDLATTGGDE